MPTILFDESFIDQERQILSKTFRANCRDLDITKFDCTVEVRRYQLDRPTLQGHMLKVTPTHFSVVLNTQFFQLGEAVYTLGHETIHIEQFLKKKMDDITGLGTIWGDKLYPMSLRNNRRNYRKLPWEQEAHDNDEALYAKALTVLSEREQRLVRKGREEYLRLMDKWHKEYDIPQFLPNMVPIFVAGPDEFAAMMEFLQGFFDR